MFGWEWSKMGAVSLVMILLKRMYLKNEKTEQIDFLYTVTNSGKLKVASDYLWMGVVTLVYKTL